MSNKAVSDEVIKLQNHLSLLREEYVKLQNRHTELERKYAISCATCGEIGDDSFVVRLLKTVADLYEQSSYSDIKIQLKEKTVPAHKFVLLARSSYWGVPNLQDVEILDWSDLAQNVGLKILKWVYTDQLDFSCGEVSTLELMKVSNNFKLQELVNKCENTLISSVKIKNCIKFYTTAQEIGASALKEHCSHLIATHWIDFTKEDFQDMNAALLYDMFKSKSQYPLHDAIRVEREDVVFLYLVDVTNKSKLNEVDDRNELPLNLALKTKQGSIAKTLVDHGADLNARDSKEYTLLHKAILRNDEYASLFLLQYGASPSIRWTQSGDGPLHFVCRAKGLNEVAKKLLQSGCDGDAQNKEGMTALHICVLAEDEVLLNLLLDNAKINLESKNESGQTALWLALKSSKSQRFGEDGNTMAEILVKNGASASAVCSPNGDSLLHLCAQEKMEAAGIFLCKNQANVNHLNALGQSPLHLSCRYGLPSLTLALLEHGVDPNIQQLYTQQTAFHVAVIEKQIECARALLNFSANSSSTSKRLQVNLKDSEGLTPLGYALKTSQFDFAVDIVTCGGNVNSKDFDGQPLLNRFIKEREENAALFLLENGANINEKTSENGESPLFLAMEGNLPVVVEALCKKGVDMSLPNHQGDCALWFALERELDEIASILVRYGVDTDFWSRGPEGCSQTLLHRSIDENKEEVGAFLIRAGCDLNAPRRPGPNGTGGDEARDQATPLHLAATWGLSYLVKTLLEHGADINLKDIEGKTPLHIAIQNQHDEITGFLLSQSDGDLSIRDKTGLSPFATAMIYKNNKAAQAILNRYPSAAEQHDSKGRNFLHVAVEKKDIESVLFLLSIKVDVNCRTKDSRQLSALHLAIETDSEMMVRNLILGGANVNERTPQKYTPLHIAAARGSAVIASILLAEGADFNALDSDMNNALHIAVKEGNLEVCRVLLAESRIDAEALNLKGQNPLLYLARYGKENSSEIFDLFIQSMPDYPINKSDVDGNTPLLLAYTQGNGGLCRSLVKAKACLGSMNKQGITIFNFQVPTKQLLYRLLDFLTEEPPWAEGDICLECGSKFSITLRKHHCRHCGRLLCSKCSDKDMPIIKFNLNKPVRVCAPCFEVLALGSSFLG